MMLTMGGAAMVSAVSGLEHSALSSGHSVDDYSQSPCSTVGNLPILRHTRSTARLCIQRLVVSTGHLRNSTQSDQRIRTKEYR
jgi:hypothetical protein